MKSILKLVSGTTLLRDGYSLAGTVVLTTGLGFFFWLLASRLYSPEIVGQGAAVISLLMTISNVSQVGLVNFFTKFLPGAGGNTRKYILRGYGLAAVFACLLSAASLVWLTSFSTTLAFIAGSTWGTVWFLCATVAWVVFMLEDAVLTGLRQAYLVPISNAAYSIAKLGALFLLTKASLGGMSLFVAWTAPVIPVALIVNAMILRMAPSGSAPKPVESAEPKGSFLSFFGWDSLGIIFTMVAVGVAPLAVIRYAGAEANARYFVSWAITYAIYLVARSMNAALLAELSSGSRGERAIITDALLHVIILVVPGVFFFVLTAPWVMGAFGPEYVEGAQVLRVLCLSAIPWAMTTMYLAVARHRGALRKVAGIQLATGVLALGTGIPLLAHMGELGMALGWLIGHYTVLAWIILAKVTEHGTSWIGNWLLRLTSASAKLWSQVTMAKAATRSEDVLKQRLPGFLEDQHIAGELQPIGEFPSSGTVVISLLGTPSDRPYGIVYASPPGTRALLKRGTATGETRSLYRQRAALERLEALGVTKTASFAVPSILALAEVAGETWSLEGLIAGEDGRHVLRRRSHYAPALMEAARQALWLHEATAVSVRVEDDWLEKWISAPVRLLEAVPPVLLSRREWARCLQTFEAAQRKFWRHRVVSLGAAHGDYNPGNVLFRISPSPASAAGTAPAPAPAVEVAGIIDWERFMEDAPEGFDLISLLLSSERSLNGGEFGPVVRELWSKGGFRARQAEWIAPLLASRPRLQQFMQDPRSLRMLVGLVWLETVTGNLRNHADISRNKLWALGNVEWVVRASDELI